MKKYILLIAGIFLVAVGEDLDRTEIGKMDAIKVKEAEKIINNNYGVFIKVLNNSYDKEELVSYYKVLEKECEKVMMKKENSKCQIIKDSYYDLNIDSMIKQG